MAEFTDARGKVWSLPEYDIAMLVRIKRDHQLNLYGELTAAINRVLADPCFAVELAHWILGDEEKVPFSEFASGIKGETIQAVQQAVFESLLTMLPPERREMMKSAIAKLKAAHQKLIDHYADQVAKLDVDAILADALSKMK